MDLQLSEKTALVTGAIVGIGRAIALALAAEGTQLAISARRIDRLKELSTHQRRLLRKGGEHSWAKGLSRMVGKNGVTV